MFRVHTRPLIPPTELIIGIQLYQTESGVDMEAWHTEHLAHQSMPEVGLLMEEVDLGDIMVGSEEGLEVGEVIAEEEVVVVEEVEEGDVDTGLGNGDVVNL